MSQLISQMKNGEAQGSTKETKKQKTGCKIMQRKYWKSNKSNTNVRLKIFEIKRSISSYKFETKGDHCGDSTTNTN